MFVLAMSFSLHLVVKPFRRDSYNLLEGLALFGELAFTFGVMPMMGIDINHSETVGFSAVSLGLASIFVVVWLASFVDVLFFEGRLDYSLRAQFPTLLAAFAAAPPPRHARAPDLRGPRPTLARQRASPIHQRARAASGGSPRPCGGGIRRKRHRPLPNPAPRQAPPPPASSAAPPPRACLAKQVLQLALPNVVGQVAHVAARAGSGGGGTRGPWQRALHPPGGRSAAGGGAASQMALPPSTPPPSPTLTLGSPLRLRCETWLRAPGSAKGRRSGGSARVLERGCAQHARGVARSAIAPPTNHAAACRDSAAPP